MSEFNHNRLTYWDGEVSVESVQDGIKDIMHGRGWSLAAVSVTGGSIKISVDNGRENSTYGTRVLGSDKITHGNAQEFWVFAVDVVAGSVFSLREVYGRIRHIGLSFEEVQTLKSVLAESKAAAA
jgi:hypothetical protein